MKERYEDIICDVVVFETADVIKIIIKSKESSKR